MYHRNLSFLDFTSKEKYCKLQHFFLNYCSRNILPEEFKEPMDENKIKIIYKSWDMYSGNEEEYLEKEFLKDFLFPKIDEMATRYFNSFKNEKSTKGIYGESFSSFVSERLNQLDEISKVLQKVDYFNDDINKRLLQQLNRLHEDISNYLENPYPNLEKKIQFNWNKADVLYFFHLLRENKQVKNLSNSEFGRIINSIVEYQDEDYEPIKDAPKRLSAFNQAVPTNVTDSKKRLFNIFSNIDFYKE